MAPNDPLDHLSSSISDGLPVDWTRAEPELDPATLQVIRDLARITEFNRELQRAPTEGEVPPTGEEQRRWGNLTLLELIGAGARGEVWRAWDPTLQREVALKFLQPSGSGGDTAALLNEARALARVRHPGVVSVYGISAHEDRAGMWMEYLRGMTLAQEIERRGVLPARDVMRLGIELCSALEAVHSAGLVHRDVKPANVILEPDGRAVLMDFGLGMRPELEEAKSARTSGTPIFMPPETLSGDVATPQSDLYALGATLWWALAGAPPFQASTLSQLREQATRGPSTPLGSVRRGLPRGLVNAIEWAMKPAASGRPKNASELSARLRRILDETDAAQQGRRRSRVVLVALSVVLISVALFGRAPLLRLIHGSPSIAVMPLVNLSGDPTEEYFSDGMTEELIGRFAGVRDLRVISRSSVMPFKNSKLPLPEIAKKLHVRMMVEGAVARDGDRVRVTAQLVDARSGRAVWGGTFERDMRNVFDLQSDVAKAVVGKVEARLTPGERGRLAATPEVNPEAHRLYLQGMAAYHLLTADGIQRAITLFQRAAEIDPTYADPWMGLTYAYDFSVAVGLLSEEESSTEGIRAARRAVELNPESGQARAALANVLLDRDWDFQAAERGLRQALALSPGDGESRGALAILLVQLGRFDEAIREARRAREADPLSLSAAAETLFPLYEGRRYPEVVQGARDILVTHPNAPWILLLLGQSVFLSGNHEEGIATIERSAQLDHTPAALGWLGYDYGRAQKPQQARAVLSELQRIRQRSYVDPYYFGIVHLGLGERAQALTYIEEAGHSHSPEAKLLRVDPLLDPLRSEPRFQTLLKQLHMAN